MTVVFSALKNWLKSGTPIIAAAEVQFPVTLADLYLFTVSPREDSHIIRTDLHFVPVRVYESGYGKHRSQGLFPYLGAGKNPGNEVVLWYLLRCSLSRELLRRCLF